MPAPLTPSTRRHWLMLAAGSALAPAFVRHARAADVERFALGVASGHPQPDGMVLWTRLGGPDLPEAVPWVLVWDDHEVDNDYAGLQDAALSPTFAARRAAAYQAYWEHQPLPPSWRPRDGAMRMYGHLDWGRDVRILCLDDRQHRDPQACPRPGRGGSNTVRRRDCAALADAARTLLGPAQEAWLQRAAWRDTARWHLLAQQTLMSPVHWSDPAHASEQRVWTDGWEGYPAARQRLLDTLPQQGGCVVLGGDVHASYVADLHADATDAASPIVAAEFCCTSISSLGMAQPHLDAMRGWNPSLHHARSQERGYTAFALQGEHLLATLRAVADPLDAASAVHTQALPRRGRAAGGAGRVTPRRRPRGAARQIAGWDGGAGVSRTAGGTISASGQWRACSAGCAAS